MLHWTVGACLGEGTLAARFYSRLGALVLMLAVAGLAERLLQAVEELQSGQVLFFLFTAGDFLRDLAVTRRRSVDDIDDSSLR